MFLSFISKRNTYVSFTKNLYLTICNNSITHNEIENVTYLGAKCQKGS